MAPSTASQSSLVKGDLLLRLFLHCTYAPHSICCFTLMERRGKLLQGFKTSENFSLLSTLSSGEFHDVFGAQEFFTLEKNKGLRDLPSGLLRDTSEVVDLGGMHEETAAEGFAHGQDALADFIFTHNVRTAGIKDPAKLFEADGKLVANLCDVVQGELSNARAEKLATLQNRHAEANKILLGRSLS